MNREDAYYIPEDDDYDYNPDTLDWEIDQLLKTDEFNPHLWSNFNEAFGACQDKEDINFLEDALQKRDFEALGRKLWNLSYEYWEKLAEGHITGNY